MLHIAKTGEKGSEKWGLSWLQQKKKELKRLRDENEKVQENKKNKIEETISQKKHASKTASRKPCKMLPKKTHSELVDYLEKFETHSAMKPWIAAIRNNSDIDGCKYASFSQKNSDPSQHEAELQSLLQSLNSEDLVPLTAVLMQNYLHCVVLSEITPVPSKIKSLSNLANAPDNDEESEIERRLQEKIRQLEKEIETMEDFLCVICQDEPKTLMFEPCKHFVCEKCAQDITTCPMCRAEIKKKIKTNR
ncbi:apoptosis inhibitor IAP [Reticulomyxa filosa]|uniref:Apoptosis inhibitor IAP n=1 Tax=Reticulomyxa filosa TaxID=46433 RepID=X6NLL6_RETFI|nr:apoptosis inhibitor IAP [Reticulomyxa filosa]|eukprot:ETO26277.1 apoptosis inhibitor IAP [Reticulomyxa filosa]